MKKLLALLLMLLLCIGLTTAVLAEAEVTTAADLQAAVNNGGTVKLGTDVNLGSTALKFPDNTPVTIDLNGHKLYNSGGFVLVIEAADQVTIADSVGTGSVETKTFYYFQNYGSLTITGGNYTQSGKNLVYTEDSSVTRITNCVMNGKNIIARQSDSSTAFIEGGTFVVNTISTGIWNEGVTITGGTFTLNTTDTPLTVYADTANYRIISNVDGSYSVTPKPPAYTISVNTAEGGTVTGGGDYEENTSVTVTATPNSGYKFVSWMENSGVVSTDASYTFPATADRSLTAVFEMQHIHGLDSTGEQITWTPISALSDITGAGSYCLTGNITSASNWTVAQDVNLCLNGYELTFDPAFSRYITVSSGASLSICDCSAQQSGRVYSSKGSYTISNKGTVNLYSGTIDYTAPNSNIAAIENYEGAVLNMYGGKLDSVFHAIRNRGTANISGGTVTSKCDAIQADAGEVNISGSAMVTTDAASTWAVVNIYGGTFNIKGGTVASGGRIAIQMPSGTSTLNISGGKVTTSGKADTLYLLSANAEVNITGGTVENTYGSLSYSSTDGRRYGWAIDLINAKSVTVSGAPVIDSIYLAAGKVLTVGKDGLTNTTPIPVYCRNTPTAICPITGQNDADYSSRFIPTPLYASSRTIYNTADNVVMMGTPVSVTGTDTQITYDGNAYDLSGMFIVEPANAGARTYTIISADGTGELNGSMLTITKAGTFVIQLDVAESGTYSAATGTATLTVNKGDAAIPTGLTAYYGQKLSEIELDEGWSWQNANAEVGNAGDNTHLADYEGNDLYAEKQNVELTVTVSQADTQLDVQGESDYYYGENIELTVKVTAVKPAVSLFSLRAVPAPGTVSVWNGEEMLFEQEADNGDTVNVSIGTVENGLIPGSYTLDVKYTASGNMNAASAEKAINVTFLPADEAPDAILSETNENGWYNADPTLTAPEGWTISEEMDSGYTSSITPATMDGENTITYYLRSEDGPIAEKTVTVNVDKTAPVITSASGQTTDTTAKYAIVAEDATSGVHSYEMVMTSGEGTPVIVNNNDGTFNVSGLLSGKRYTFQITVTDKAGNSTVIASTVETTFGPYIIFPTGETEVHVFVGQKAEMKVVAENAYRYEWYMSVDGGTTFLRIPDATTPEYAIEYALMKDNGNLYFCRAYGESDVLYADSPIFKLRVEETLPQTGDDMPLALLIGLCLMSLTAMLFISRRKVKE